MIKPAWFDKLTMLSFLHQSQESRFSLKVRYSIKLFSRHAVDTPTILGMSR
jgi:hypothetical protein